MEVHMRLYTCVVCKRSQSFWVPLPPPVELVLKGGGCRHCTTPQSHFTLMVNDG